MTGLRSFADLSLPHRCLRIFVYLSFNFYDEGSYNQVAGSEILTSLHSGAELPWSHWCY